MNLRIEGSNRQNVEAAAFTAGKDDGWRCIVGPGGECGLRTEEDVKWRNVGYGSGGGTAMETDVTPLYIVEMSKAGEAPDEVRVV